MKKILFLLLFPTFAIAQYTGNANQKITLGEQTTADGLVFRGDAADTLTATLKITKTNKQDTSTYLLLDTINNVLLKYNIATTYWTRLNLLPTDTASMLGNYWRSGRFSGVLPVANGGTNTSTLNQNKLMVGNGTSGVLTPTDLHWNNSTNLLGIGETNLSDFKLTVKGAFPILFNTTSTSTSLTYGGTRFFRNTSALNSGNGFQYAFNDANNNLAEYGYFGGYIIDNTAGSPDGGFIFAPTLNNARTEAMRILNDGKVGIGTIEPTEKLHVVGNARITAVGALGGNSATLYRNSDGVLSTTSSDINKKHNVRPIIYGLETISQLNPVNFQWNVDESEDIGFIAQDIQNIIPESIETDWDSNLIFKYEKLIPILTKAIQEQQALIKALEQRLLILENK